MAKHVDSSTYEEIKTGAGVSATIYGVPIGANYDEYQKNISTFSLDEDAFYSNDEFRNISWTGLSEQSADAYKTCIRSQKRGLVLVPDKATDSDISFILEYSVVGGSPNPLPVSWFGIEVGSNRLPDAVSAGEQIVIIKRPEKTSTLAVNGAANAGFADSVTLTPFKEPVNRLPIKCIITQTDKPSAIVRGQYFTWTCPRLQQGVYRAIFSVSPSANRAVRVTWSVDLDLIAIPVTKRPFIYQRPSGPVIDVGVTGTGIGNSFESNDNVMLDEPGLLPIFKVFIGHTAWHMDFSQPSDDPITIPRDVTISLVRQ